MRPSFCDDGVMIDAPLSVAVAVFVGQAGRLDEVSPEQRVVERVGYDAALDLLPRVRAVVDGLYGADPPLSYDANPPELGRRASEWLHRNHPELSPDAVRAVANKFAYDWR